MRRMDGATGSVGIANLFTLCERTEGLYNPPALEAILGIEVSAGELEPV